MLDKEYEAIVWRCDGDDCTSILRTDTANFENALVILTQSEWRKRKVGETWLHFCPDCQVAFMPAPRRYGDE